MVWFAQVEAQFLTRNTTSQKTIFAYVIAALQPKIAQEVRDLLITPPADQPYDTLKRELIQRTTATEQKCLHQLLISEELGDRKPSQLLRRMRQLLGESALQDPILRQLFLQRLPMKSQLILASSADTVPIEQLATLADKILEIALPSHSVATLSAPTHAVHSAVPEVTDLHCRVDALTSQIQSLLCQLQIRDSSRSPARSQISFRPPTVSPQCFSSTQLYLLVSSPLWY